VGFFACLGTADKSLMAATPPGLHVHGAITGWLAWLPPHCQLPVASRRAPPTTAADVASCTYPVSRGQVPTTQPGRACERLGHCGARGRYAPDLRLRC
jgi:hypothetical protein